MSREAHLLVLLEDFRVAVSPGECEAGRAAPTTATFTEVRDFPL
jgi:hypothetical protein